MELNASVLAFYVQHNTTNYFTIYRFIEITQCCNLSDFDKKVIKLYGNAFYNLVCFRKRVRENLEETFNLLKEGMVYEKNN